MSKEKNNESIEMEDDVKLFFKAFKIILILSMILLIGTVIQAFFVLGNIQSNSVNDMNYTFEENILLDWENPNYNSGYNTKNMTQYTDTYNATYSFTNDNGGTAPTGFSVLGGVGCNTSVLDYLDGHSKITDSYDNGIGAIRLTNYITNITYGSVEYWIRMTEVADMFAIELLDGSTFVLRITSSAGDWLWWDGSWNDFGDAVANTWYHFRIDFECTGGGYLGLNQYTWRLYMNGKKFGNFNFDNSQSEVNRLQFITSGGQTEIHGYVDAIGFTWDTDYNINDNIIPYSFQNETLEISKWEFFNNEDGTVTFPGQQTIPFWDELLTAGKILNSIPGFYDETGACFNIENTNHEGIERSLDLPTANIIQINFTFYYGPRYGTQKWYTIIDVDSYDDTLICRLRMDDDAVQKDLKLSYWNGVSFIEIEDLTDASAMLNITITIIDNLILLDTRTDIYTFPILTINKVGLGDIKFETYGGGDYDANAYIYIDSIGVYANNISLSDDFGNYYYNVSNDFYNRYNNLFTINSTGFFGTSMISYNTGQTFAIFPYQNTVNLSFMNLYNPDVYPIEQAFFVVSTNSSFEIYSLFITGVTLIQDTNIYYPVITDNSINNNESYFYVSSDRLYFTMTTDDDNLEFIQATFTVNSQESTNYSMIWGGRKTYLNLFGEFRVNYDDSSYNSFLLRTTMIYSNQIIPQEKNIINFDIVITDNDNDVDNTINGYINSITLLYSPDASLNIYISNYLNIIPGISLIVVITVIIWGLSRKKVGNMLVVPSIVGTAYLSYISTFVPMWLLFTILVSCGALIYSKWKDLFLIFVSFTNMILGFLHYGGVIDLWLFYLSFMLLVGYIIFVGVKDIRGLRTE